MKTSVLIGGVVAGAMAFAGTSQAALVMLDDFNGDNFFLHVPTDIAGTNAAVTTNVAGNFVPFLVTQFGDEREVSLSVDTFNGVATGTASVAIPGNSGVLSFSSGSVLAGQMTSIEYDDFISADVSGGGLNTALGVNVNFIDAPVLARIILSDGVNTASSSAVLSSAGVTLIGLPGGVDLTAVTSVTLELEAQAAGADVAIDNVFFTVPEPASMALLAIGGLVALPRRRQA